MYRFSGVIAAVAALTASNAHALGALVAQESVVWPADGINIDLSLPSVSLGGSWTMEGLEPQRVFITQPMLYTVVFNQPVATPASDGEIASFFDEIDYLYEGNGPYYGGFYKEVGGGGSGFPNYTSPTVRVSGNTLTETFRVDDYVYGDGYAGPHKIGDMLTFQYSMVTDYINYAYYGPDAAGKLWSISVYASTVPEPTSWALMLLGLLAGGASLRARRRDTAPAV